MSHSNERSEGEGRLASTSDDDLAGEGFAYRSLRADISAIKQNHQSRKRRTSFPIGRIWSCDSLFFRASFFRASRRRERWLRRLDRQPQTEDTLTLGDLRVLRSGKREFAIGRPLETARTIIEKNCVGTHGHCKISVGCEDPSRSVLLVSGSPRARDSNDISKGLDLRRPFVRLAARGKLPCP